MHTLLARTPQHAPHRAKRAAFTIETEAAGIIRIEVTRKQIKNLNLRVRSDGSVVASAPIGTSDARIQSFLDRRSDWIASHVLRRRTPEGHIDVESAALPANYPLWGTLVPLDEFLEGDALPAPITREEAGTLVRARYRTEVTRALPAVVERLEREMGVAASRWSIRTMKTRWGSCTPHTRAIRINTRLAAYPSSCLEFVVAHELCHLMEPSHNRRFHMLLDAYCPRNRELAALLRKPAREIAHPR